MVQARVILINTTRRITRFAIILLAAALCLAIAPQLQAQSARLAIPIYAHISNSLNSGGFGFGGGLRWQRHEVSCQYQAIRAGYNGKGFQYRFFMPFTHRVVSPFLAVNGTIANLADAANVGGITYRMQTRGIWLGAGASYKPWSNFTMNLTLGMGHTWFSIPEVPGEQFDLGTGFYRLAAQYDLPVIRDREHEYEKNNALAPWERFSIEVRGGIGRGGDLNQEFRGTKTWLYPAVECRLGSVIALFAGPQLGNLKVTEPDTMERALGYQGVGGGLRLYTWRGDRFSFRHEIGWYYARRESWKYNLTGIQVGNHLLYQLTDGLTLLGGIGARVTDSDILYSVELGLKVSPFHWIKRNL